jgi:hypothetical protein
MHTRVPMCSLADHTAAMWLWHLAQPELYHTFQLAGELFIGIHYSWWKMSLVLMNDAARRQWGSLESRV